MLICKSDKREVGGRREDKGRERRNIQKGKERGGTERGKRETREAGRDTWWEREGEKQAGSEEGRKKGRKGREGDTEEGTLSTNYLGLLSRRKRKEAICAQQSTAISLQFFYEGLKFLHH